MVIFQRRIVHFIDFICFTAVMCFCYWTIVSKANHWRKSKRRVFERILIFAFIEIGSILAAATSIVLIAATIDSLRNPMSWYSNSFLLFGLYFSPQFFYKTFFHALYIHSRKFADMHGNMLLLFNGKALVFAGTQILLSYITKCAVFGTITLVAYNISMTIMIVMQTYVHGCK